MSQDFVGAGLAFPLRTDATGAIALVRGDQEIQEAIRLILSTSPGERPMRPTFGCGINDYVFASADAATGGLIAREVRQALAMWEPRITVNDVIVSYVRASAGELYIGITYTINATNSLRNLVFPFYVIPEHREERV